MLFKPEAATSSGSVTVEGTRVDYTGVAGIAFLYNDGPGSSSVWLHIGALGPRRVVTADNNHTSAVPYDLADNSYSLLDASDLVFVDARATGFSRVAGRDEQKAFFGIDADADADAFQQFVKGGLSRDDRWHSPKYEGR